jgi:hypothetical protein
VDIDTKEGMAEAVAWFNNFTAKFNEGGTWGIPRSNSVYLVFPSEKRLVRLSASRDSSTERVAKAAGWVFKASKKEKVK